MLAIINPQTRGAEEEIDSGYQALIALHRAQARAAGADQDQDREQWHQGRADYLADLAATHYQADDGRDWLRISILGICFFFVALLLGVAVLRG